MASKAPMRKSSGAESTQNAVAKTVAEISNLDVREISFVDRPAVPKAKLLAIKSQSKMGLIEGFIKPVEEQLRSVVAGMKRRNEWDSVPDASKAEILSALNGATEAIEASKGLDAMFKGAYDPEDRNTDWLLSDMNYACGMIMNTKSSWMYIAEQLKTDEGKALYGEMKTHLLEALKVGAKMFAEVIDQLGDESAEMEDEDMSIKGQKAETPPAEKPTVEQLLAAVMAKMEEMAASFTAKIEALETKLSESVAAQSTPEEEAPAVEEQIEGEIPEDVLSEEEIAAAQALLESDELTDEERASIEAGLEATVAYMETVASGSAAAA